MDEVTEKNILKAVQRKFPVCNIIDARTYNGREVSNKCNDKPSTTSVKISKKMFTVTLCTGSFNVYVLKIEENE